MNNDDKKKESTIEAFKNLFKSKESESKTTDSKKDVDVASIFDEFKEAIHSTRHDFNNMIRGVSDELQGDRFDAFKKTWEEISSGVSQSLNSTFSGWDKTVESWEKDFNKASQNETTKTDSPKKEKSVNKDKEDNMSNFTSSETVIVTTYPNGTSNKNNTTINLNKSEKPDGDINLTINVDGNKYTVSGSTRDFDGIKDFKIEENNNASPNVNRNTTEVKNEIVDNISRIINMLNLAKSEIEKMDEVVNEEIYKDFVSIKDKSNKICGKIENKFNRVLKKIRKLKNL